MNDTSIDPSAVHLDFNMNEMSHSDSSSSSSSISSDDSDILIVSLHHSYIYSFFVFIFFFVSGKVKAPIFPLWVTELYATVRLFVLNLLPHGTGTISTASQWNTEEDRALDSIAPVQSVGLFSRIRGLRILPQIILQFSRRALTVLDDRMRVLVGEAENN